MRKRLFDLLLTIPGIVLVSPILGGVALALLISEGRPVIYRQPRGGLKGTVFHIYKFRTMREAYDHDGNLLADEKRISKLGRFLRAASLDELPELINVLRGEMSLVGPRPLMAKYLSRYSAEQMQRHDTLPGITGWAQINGRNALSWEDRFNLDVWYTQHWNMRLDISILARTLAKVARREGISEPGQATMTEFMGSEK
ncbi:MAG: sugar transferase [Anaerolineaceae bacterium]|nr:sugar transferase [Anaerolineaceae bacterium]